MTKRRPRPTSPTSAPSSSSSSSSSKSPLRNVNFACYILRHVRVKRLRDIIKCAQINDAFRDALESWSPTFWRRVTERLAIQARKDKRKHGLSTRLDAFFEHDAFAWAARNILTVGQLHVEVMYDHPLHIAAESNSVDIVRVCIFAIPDCVDVRDEDGWSALLLAAAHGNIECVRELLAAGADITFRTGSGDTALSSAAAQGYVDVVRLLIAHPDFVKIRDQGALHVASVHGHAECVRELLAAGAAADSEDEDDEEDVEYEYDGDGDEGDDFDDDDDDDEDDDDKIIDGRNTLLHYAAQHGDVDTVRRLVAQDDFAKVRDLHNIDGETALHVASFHGHTECVRELLAAGVDIEESGHNALHAAAGGGNVGVVRLLVAHAEFAKMRDRCVDGKTALHVAAEMGRTECVHVLLAAGADLAGVDISTSDSVGATALHWAAAQGDVDVVRRLVAHPDFAKIRDLRSDNGNTAVDVAASEEVEELLNTNTSQEGKRTKKKTANTRERT